MANGNPPFTYSIDGSTFQTGNTFANLSAGTYQVSTRDATGCTATAGAVVTQFSKIAFTFTKTNVSCNGTSDGSLTVTASHGAGGYKYKLSTSNIYQPSGSFTNLSVGVYKVNIRDANSCTITTVGLKVGKAACATTVAKTDKSVDEGDASPMRVVLSPNPAAAAFTLQIQSAKNELADVRVVDVNSKVVYRNKVAPGQSIRFGESFITGVYFIEVRQGHEIKTLKAVKIR